MEKKLHVLSSTELTALCFWASIGIRHSLSGSFLDNALKALKKFGPLLPMIAWDRQTQNPKVGAFYRDIQSRVSLVTNEYQIEIAHLKRDPLAELLK